MPRCCTACVRRTHTLVWGTLPVLPLVRSERTHTPADGVSQGVALGGLRPCAWSSCNLGRPAGSSIGCQAVRPRTQQASRLAAQPTHPPPPPPPLPPPPTSTSTGPHSTTHLLRRSPQEEASSRDQQQGPACQGLGAVARRGEPLPARPQHRHAASGAQLDALPSAVEEPTVDGVASWGAEGEHRGASPTGAAGGKFALALALQPRGGVAPLRRAE